VSSSDPSTASAGQRTNTAPAIRVLDLVAASGGPDGQLAAGHKRLLEISLDEFDRLLRMLGAEGLIALNAYLRALRREAAPGGGYLVIVDDFSARWLLENTELTRNAAYRAQRALERSGLFSAITSQPGLGARGKQRGALNPDLVLIQGGADGDATPLRRGLAGPVSRKPGDWETGGQTPVSRKVGDWETGPNSQSPGFWETGNVNGSQARENATLPESGDRETGVTRSSSAVGQLLGTSQQEGLLAAVLVPGLRSGAPAVRSALYGLFNATQVAERATELAKVLGYAGPRTGLAEFLTDFCAGLLLGELDAAEQLSILGVQGTPWGDMPADKLAERALVAILAGLGMKRVEAWGGWLNTATRPSWSPARTALTDSLARTLAVMAREPRRTGLDRHDPAVDAGAGAALAAPPVARPRLVEDHRQAEVHSGLGGGDEDLAAFAELDDATIAEWLPEVQRRMPFLPKSKMSDPAFQRLIVGTLLAEDSERRQRA